MRSMNGNKKMLFTIYWRSFFIQALWNFERMQNVGFAYGLLPLIRMLYPDPEKRKEVLLRHLGFFNVHPYMVTIIFGIVASMEKDLTEGKSVTPEEITMLKANMAGPLSAIGDTFFWATWRPFTALLGASLILFFYDVNTFRGTWLPPLFFLVSYNLIQLPFRYWSLKIGFQLRGRIVRVIAGMEFQRAVNTIRYAGLFVLAIVLIYYLAVFAPGFNEKVIFGAFFLLTLLFGYVRVPPLILFYGTVLLAVGLAWLGIY